MKKVRLTVFILLMLFVSACGKKVELKEEQLSVSENPHLGINDLVTPLNSSQINVDGVLISIVGLDYGKKLKVTRENGWKSSDNRSISGNVITSFGEGIAKGISGADSKDKDKDGELVIYMEMYLSEDQRPKVADVPIKVTDDKDADSEIYRSSYTYEPMSPDNKYLEAAEFKVYSDASFFFIKIGNEHLFKVEAPEFKWE